MLKTAIFAFAVGVSGAVVADDMLSQQNLVFNPGRLPAGTPTAWAFRTSTDNAVATLLVDSQGTQEGAVPDGYAQLVLRAQDEVRGAFGAVLSSSDMHGMLRVMSRSYGFTTDPHQGACRGTQCPEMLELYSDRHLRLTAAIDGIVDIRSGIRQPIAVNRAGEGELKNEKGYRPNRLHQWLTEDIGDPILAQHIHALLMFQRLALTSGYGWIRFVQMVDQVLPKRGDTLHLPFGPNDASGPAQPSWQSAFARGPITLRPAPYRPSCRVGRRPGSYRQRCVVPRSPRSRSA